MGNGSDRNQPCACGSGKKFERCCIHRKPAQQSVVFAFDEAVAVDGFSLGPAGEVRVFSQGRPINPSTASLVESRPRAKGAKMLSTVPLVGDRMTLQPAHALMRYRNIFFIDANTVTTARGGLTVAPILIGQTGVRDGKLGMRLFALGAMMFLNCHTKPENLALATLQSMMVAGANYRDADRFLIVNDSDLGNHRAFNAQELPIRSEHYLRPNIEIAYASADSGNHLTNCGIRQCDRIATDIIDRCKSAGEFSDLPFSTVLDGPCEGFQFLMFEAEIPQGWLRLRPTLPFSAEPPWATIVKSA